MINEFVLLQLHGRSRMQRYTKSADWDYISQCAQIASPMPLFGNSLYIFLSMVKHFYLL